MIAGITDLSRLAGRVPRELWTALETDLPRLFFAERTTGASVVLAVALLGGVALLAFRGDDPPAPPAGLGGAGLRAAGDAGGDGERGAVLADGPAGPVGRVAGGRVEGGQGLVPHGPPAERVRGGGGGAGAGDERVPRRQARRRAAGRAVPRLVQGRRVRPGLRRGRGVAGAGGAGRRRDRAVPRAPVLPDRPGGRRRAGAGPGPRHDGRGSAAAGPRLRRRLDGLPRLRLQAEGPEAGRARRGRRALPRRTWAWRTRCKLGTWGGEDWWIAPPGVDEYRLRPAWREGEP